MILRDIQKYKQGYEHNPDSVCTLDMQGIITSVNNGNNRIARSFEGATYWCSILKYVHPDDKEHARHTFQENH